MARWWRRGAAGSIPGGSIPAGPSTPTPPARDAAPAPAPPDRAPVQRAEWLDVPPLRPVVTAISPVAPSDAFARTLAAWQNPSFLQPLGHAVDPEGPAGHVDGLAVPAAPRTVSGGADLPVATRVAAGTATVQRAAGPWMGFAGPPTAAGPNAAFGEPFPGSGFTADAREQRTLSVAPAAPSGGALTVAPELPVRSTLPAVPRPSPSSPLTAAPGTPTVSRSVADDGHSLDLAETRAPSPALELPSPIDPTHHHAQDDDEHGREARPDAVPVAESSSGSAESGTASLIGDQASSPTAAAGAASDGSAADNDHPATDLASASGTTMPLAAVSRTPASIAPSAVQRSAADRAHRAPGLGAPLPTAPTAPTIQRAGSSDNDVKSPPVQRAVATPTRPSTSSALAVTPISGARPPAPQPSSEKPAEQSEALSSASIVPLVGSAPVMRAVDPAQAGAESGRTARAHGPVGPPAATSPTASSSAVPTMPTMPAVPTTPRPGDGSQTAVDVQRGVGGDLPSVKTRPVEAPTTDSASGGAGSSDPDTPLPGLVVAPTLGTGPIPPGIVDQQQESTSVHRDSGGPLTVTTRPALDLGAGAPQVQRMPDVPSVTGHVTDEPVSMVPGAHHDSQAEGNPAVASVSAGPSAIQAPMRLIPLLGERVAPRLALGTPIGPAVQRVAAPAATAEQTSSAKQPHPSVGGAAATRDHATKISPTSVAVQRSPSATPATGARPGLGAALPRVPSSIGQDTVSVRAMPLEQMFAPGAAAIASGAAHSDGAGSVVFHAPTVDEPAEWPAVQRFGLPGADALSGASTLANRARSAGGGLLDSARSAAGGYGDRAESAGGGLLDSARNAAGGYADTARNAAGGYADTARNAVGSYADSARNTVGGYADSARNAAGSYADSARNAVGGYADTARTLAGGYADSARGAAGSAVNAAETAVGDTAGAARGVAGQAVDSAQSAASGAAGAAQNAVATAAGAAGGAVAGAAGAAGAAANALPTDLDELARRLFDPLSARLKSELWLDRERAGMVTDLRR